MEEVEKKEVIEDAKVEMLHEDAKEKPQSKKANAEQIKNYITTLQQRCMQLEQQIKSIDMTAFRLNTLFKVLDHKEVFPSEFIKKCSDEIVDIIEYDAEGEKTEGNPSENVDTPTENKD